jgi:adenosylcobinamide-phosphate synthase
MSALTSPFLPLLLAAALDFLIGDPKHWLHPVQVMGWFISAYTHWVFKLLHAPIAQRIAGIGLAIALIIGSGAIAWFTVDWATQIHPAVSLIVQTIGLASCFAGRSLRSAAMDVLAGLNVGETRVATLSAEHSSAEHSSIEHSLIEARNRLKQYVGRDTDNLSGEDILRAVLETVTENAVDGVLAPLFFAIAGSFTPLGSLPVAIAYKAASTLDSMVGYKDAPYTDLGWFSARLEDYLTWIPCRLAVLTLALLSGQPTKVWQLCRRDAPNDPSPNAGWSECAYAAVLGVQMGGDNYYRGVLKHKPLLGEPLQPITGDRIDQAFRFTRTCFLLWLGMAGLIHLLVYLLIYLPIYLPIHSPIVPWGWKIL